MASKGRYHELIKAIDSCSNWQGKRESIDQLRACIENQEKQGWDRNGDIPDEREENRYPLIHWAAVLGKYIALKWLLRNGFFPDAKSSKGETALHTALEMPYLQPKHRQPSTKQLIKRFSETIVLLRDLLPVKDVNGNTPLHAAAKQLVEENKRPSFFARCCEVIISKSKAIDMADSQNNSGETALHILARAKGKEAVKYCAQTIRKLVAAGANSSIKNRKGLTALDIATKFRNRPIMKALPIIIEDESEEDSSSDKVLAANTNGETGCPSYPPSELSDEDDDETSRSVFSVQSEETIAYPEDDKECSSQLLENEVSNGGRTAYSEPDTTHLYSKALKCLQKACREDENNLQKVQIQVTEITDQITDKEKKIKTMKKKISTKKKKVQEMKKELSSMESEVSSLKRKREECDKKCGEIQKRLKSESTAKSILASNKNDKE